MLARERQNKIIEMLQNQKIVKISEIVHLFDVSNETARRDLESVQDMGIARRIYGGAVLIAPTDRKNNLLQGQIVVRQHGREERDAIGQMAATLIHEGESVILDTGTTVHEIAKRLKGMHNLTVLTNSIHVLNELLDSEITVYVMGGRLNPDERTLTGYITENAINSFYVDKAFVGAGGVTFDGGISDYNIYESSYKKLICDHASKVYLVAHSEKFGTNALAASFPLSKVDVIITDTNLNPEYADRIRDMGIELIMVDVAANKE